MSKCAITVSTHLISRLKQMRFSPSHLHDISVNLNWKEKKYHRNLWIRIPFLQKVVFRFPFVRSFVRILSDKFKELRLMKERNQQAHTHTHTNSIDRERTNERIWEREKTEYNQLKCKDVRFVSFLIKLKVQLKFQCIKWSIHMWNSKHVINEMTTIKIITIIILTVQRIEWNILNPDPMDMSRPITERAQTHTPIIKTKTHSLASLIYWAPQSWLSFILNSFNSHSSLTGYDSGSVNWDIPTRLLAMCLPKTKHEHRVLRIFRCAPCFAAEREIELKIERWLGVFRVISFEARESR